MKKIWTTILIFIPILTFCQKKKIFFYNQLAFSLNGAGDLGGYKIDAGAQWEIFKNTNIIAKFGVAETKGDLTTLIHYQGYQSDAVITLTGAINRNLKLTKWLTISPEVGFILRNHKWTIVTGPTFSVIKGDHIVPPGTGARWQDNGIGYHIQFPFIFKLSNKTEILLFAEYENDNFGYTFFSVGTGIRFRLR